MAWVITRDGLKTEEELEAEARPLLCSVCKGPPRPAGPDLVCTAQTSCSDPAVWVCICCWWCQECFDLLFQV